MGVQQKAGGDKFKTPALEPAQAVEYLRFHREDAHGQREAAAGEVLVRSNFPRYQDQKSVEAAVRRTSSSSRPQRDLSVTCTCGLNVSEVDKCFRISLIGGLNGEDTKQEFLSKVDEMHLLWTEGS
jgi:hypothetical protein